MPPDAATDAGAQSKTNLVEECELGRKDPYCRIEVGAESRALAQNPIAEQISSSARFIPRSAALAYFHTLISLQPVLLCIRFWNQLCFGPQDDYSR